MSGPPKASDDLRRMIKREQEIADAARRMRASARNKTVRSQCDSQIAEAARNISYLEEQLGKLTLGPQSPHKSDPVAAPAPASSAPANTPGNGKITRLDLFRWDRPASMGPRIRLMLQQLEYKTSIEEQYERGTRKLIDLYGQTGDRRSQTEAYDNLAESRGKMALLKRSKKRYSDMNLAAILGSSQGDDEEEFGVAMGAPNVRKPLTGILRVVVQQVEDVDHTIAWADQVEMWVTMKVENNSAATARTRATRTSQFHEDFTIPVDKGNEIEFTVYDRSVSAEPNGTANPVALMWLRISDIAEAIRQKRVEREFARTGWASAEEVKARGSPGKAGPAPVGASGASAAAGAPVNTAASTGASAPPASGAGGAGSVSSGSTGGSGDAEDMVSGWFTLEPAGRVFLKLGFEKTGGNKRARVYDGSHDLGRLGRHNAIRKREETQQVHGHEFELYQAYNIVRCAVCGDFTTSYFQCQECQLTCDRKCFSRIVTKCTALMSQDPDEEELNHRIPHHFEPTSNMKATWCAQCGFILPLASKKNVRKCAECGIMVHSNCSQYVPDLCGISMETAAQVVNEINSTRIRQATKAAAGSYAAPQHTPTPSLTSSSPDPSPVRSAYGQAKTPSVVPPTKGPVRRKQVPAPPEAPQTAPQVPPIQKSPQGAQKLPPQPAGPRVPSPPRPAGYSPPRPPQVPPPQSPSQVPPRTAPPVPGTAPQVPPLVPSQVPSQAPQISLPALQGAQAASQTPTVPSPTTPPPPPAPRSVGSPRESEATQPSASPEIPPKHANRLSMVGRPTPEELHENARKQASALLQPKKQRRRKVGLDDFSFLAVLGKGNFGKVMLAESNHTGQLYAVKVLKKNFIIDNREVESTRSEKRVFLIANRERHPFLVNLSACFQTENRIYFVMDYVSGGDLMFHIQSKMFSAKRAQFYAAEVLLALKHFHDNDVIYRDLKLDNILLSTSGHIKIADYGLCKENMGPGQTTGTFCGTPDFIAPEILLDQKYNRSVDWWALGVLMYQMLLGKSPFHGNDEDEIYDAILSDEPLYPIHMPRDSVSILQQLLTRDPSKRLGSGPRGADEIMGHPYFANINFDDLLALKVEPPYKPDIDSPTDVRYFERDFTSEMPALTPMNSTLTPEMQEEFRGFSYSLGDSI